MALFEIKYRVNTDQLKFVENRESEVYGFFQINFGNQSFGFCPKDQIPLEGSDLLSTWFEQLVEMCLFLSEYDLVIINDISSYNNMFRFRKHKNKLVVIDQLFSENKEGSISTKDIDATIGTIRDFQISQRRLKQVIKSSVLDFTDTLFDSNPEYTVSIRVRKLKDSAERLNS